MEMEWCPGQRSPAFLAPGIGFMEDSFSKDGGVGRESEESRSQIPGVHSSCRGHTPMRIQCSADLTGGRAEAVMQSEGEALNSDEA